VKSRYKATRLCNITCQMAVFFTGLHQNWQLLCLTTGWFDFTLGQIDQSVNKSITVIFICNKNNIVGNGYTSDICHICLNSLMFMEPCIARCVFYIPIRCNLYTMFFIIISALHVSGGFSAHHQELIKLYVQPWVLSCFPAVCCW